MNELTVLLTFRLTRYLCCNNVKHSQYISCNIVQINFYVIVINTSMQFISFAKFTNRLNFAWITNKCHYSIFWNKLSGHCHDAYVSMTLQKGGTCYSVYCADQVVLSTFLQHGQISKKMWTHFGTKMLTKESV